METSANRHHSLVQLDESDWPLWRCLRLQALEDAPDAFGSTLAQWSGVNDLEERWRDRLRSCGTAIVCIVDQQPAGMVATTPPIATETELQSMWVAPQFRGSGVGDQLVVAILDWARQHELRQVRLRVRLMNLVAQRLYQRHGFIDAGKPPDEVHGVCEIEMVHLL